MRDMRGLAVCGRTLTSILVLGLFGQSRADVLISEQFEKNTRPGGKMCVDWHTDDWHTHAPAEPRILLHCVGARAAASAQQKKQAEYPCGVLDRPSVPVLRCTFFFFLRVCVTINAGTNSSGAPSDLSRPVVLTGTPLLCGGGRPGLEPASSKGGGAKLARR